MILPDVSTLEYGKGSAKCRHISTKKRGPPYPQTLDCLSKTWNSILQNTLILRQNAQSILQQPPDCTPSSTLDLDLFLFPKTLWHFRAESREVWDSPNLEVLGTEYTR
ncbi:uncharacterized protein LOC143144520 [Ptiloglossa arizonensis]|uniref:uncharacterized protein LOC143144520 n=1 Tax=Ptiloglossa arizonensis TaxID=3350558 RepID=UPI003FA05F42